MKHLGKSSELRFNNPTIDVLDKFPNPHPENEYLVKHTCPEFTSLCPKTGFPDFAMIEINFWPHLWCVETKSLKLYLHCFRDFKSFMEANTNKIANDLIELLDPFELDVKAFFTPRGGIQSMIQVKHEKET